MVLKISFSTALFLKQSEKSKIKNKNLPPAPIFFWKFGWESKNLFGVA